MATSHVDDLTIEDETSLTKIRARPTAREERRATSRANNERNGIDSSIKIIEIHSEPEMNIENDSSSDSEIMADLLTTDCRIDILNNNGETCNSILNYPTLKELTITKVLKVMAKDEKSDLFSDSTRDLSFKHDDPTIHVLQDASKTSTEGKTNLVKDDNQNISSEIEKTSNITPLKNNFLKPSVIEVWSTPTKNIMSMRKQQDSPIRQPSGKENKFKHVMSPVAMYIKGSLQNHGPGSFSPRFNKKPGNERCNKEDTQPQIVYRTPKQTGLVAGRKIFPMNHLIKSTSSSSSSVVIRIHTHAERTPKKKIVPQNDTDSESLIPEADLSIHILQ